MQGRARHALRGRDPSEHGEGIKFPLGHGLTEKYPSRFISDAHVDTNLFPLALQDLLDQLPGPVTCRGHDLECQAFACGVTPDASPFNRQPASSNRAAARFGSCVYLGTSSQCIQSKGLMLVWATVAGLEQLF